MRKTKRLLKGLLIVACLFSALVGGGCTGATSGAPVTVWTDSHKTASLAVMKLQLSDLPIGDVRRHTENNDDLLGRSGQYVAKTSWADTRLRQPGGDELVGGSISEFANSRDMQESVNSITWLSSMLPVFARYTDRLETNGPLLLRLDSDLTDEQAEEYADVFRNIRE